MVAQQWPWAWRFEIPTRARAPPQGRMRGADIPEDCGGGIIAALKRGKGAVRTAGGPSPDVQTQPSPPLPTPRPVRTASPGCRAGAVGKDTLVTQRPHSCLRLGAGGGPSAWGVYWPKEGLPSSRPTLPHPAVPSACPALLPTALRLGSTQHTGASRPLLRAQLPTFLVGQTSRPADRCPSLCLACRTQPQVLSHPAPHSATPHHHPRAREEAATLSPSDTTVVGQPSALLAAPGEARTCSPTSRPQPALCPGPLGWEDTSAPSVEEPGQFTGSLEVEERSHGEDEARADEKCPQEEAGCHLRAPCKRGEGCQGQAEWPGAPMLSAKAPGLRVPRGGSSEEAQCRQPKPTSILNTHRHGGPHAPA